MLYECYTGIIMCVKGQTKRGGAPGEPEVLAPRSARHGKAKKAVCWLSIH